MSIKTIGLAVGGVVLVAGVGYAGYQAYQKWFGKSEPTFDFKAEIDEYFQKGDLSDIVEFGDQVSRKTEDTEVIQAIFSYFKEKTRDVMVRKEQTAAAMRLELAELVRTEQELLKEKEELLNEQLSSSDDEGIEKIQLSEEAAVLGQRYDQLKMLEEELAQAPEGSEQRTTISAQIAEVSAEISALIAPKLNGTVIQMPSRKKRK